MDKPTTLTSLQRTVANLPTLDGLVESGEAVPNYQPGVFTLHGPGWRELRIDPAEDLYWPGDSKPEGYGELGLATVRLLSSGKADDEIEEIIAEYSRLDKVTVFSDDCPRITEHDRIEARRRLTEVYGEAEADRLLKVLEEAPTYRGPIAFDDAVELAKRHCSYFRPNSECERELHDWLVSSFFTLAGDGEDSPCFANGSAYIPVTPDMLPAGLALNEAAVTRCVQKAASSRIHHDALRKAAVIFLREHRLLGALADFLEPASRAPDGVRGRRPWVNTLRDKAIVATIKRLEAEGLTATRSEASTKPESACDAVAKAISLTYQGVLKIWKKRPRPAYR